MIKGGVRKALRSSVTPHKKVIIQFDKLYYAARSSTQNAHKYYPRLLATYEIILHSTISPEIKNRTYRQTREMYRLSKPPVRQNKWIPTPPAWLMPLVIITLFVFSFSLLLRPGITGLLGVDTRSVSEALALSSSSSPTIVTL